MTAVGCPISLLKNFIFFQSVTQRQRGQGRQRALRVQGGQRGLWVLGGATGGGPRVVGDGRRAAAPQRGRAAGAVGAAGILRARFGISTAKR